MTDWVQLRAENPAAEVVHQPRRLRPRHAVAHGVLLLRARRGSAPTSSSVSYAHSSSTCGSATSTMPSRSRPRSRPRWRPPTWRCARTSPSATPPTSWPCATSAPTSSRELVKSLWGGDRALPGPGAHRVTRAGPSPPTSAPCGARRASRCRRPARHDPSEGALPARRPPGRTTSGCRASCPPTQPRRRSPSSSSSPASTSARTPTAGWPRRWRGPATSRSPSTGSARSSRAGRHHAGPRPRTRSRPETYGSRPAPRRRGPSSTRSPTLNAGRRRARRPARPRARGLGRALRRRHASPCRSLAGSGSPQLRAASPSAPTAAISTALGWPSAVDPARALRRPAAHGVRLRRRRHGRPAPSATARRRRRAGATRSQRTFDEASTVHGRDAWLVELKGANHFTPVELDRPHLGPGVPRHPHPPPILPSRAPRSARSHRLPRRLRARRHAALGRLERSAHPPRRPRSSTARRR